MSSLSIQKAAPDFTAEACMPDGSFKNVSLSDYKGKYVVLFFYPLDFTFVCPTEIIAFSDRMKEFEDLDVQVLGVSVDSKFAHYHFAKADRKNGGLGGCAYPLIADITKGISKQYEVLIEDGEDAGLSLRGLFIISDKGILRQKTVNDLPVGRDVDETIRLIQAFKYTDEHGEVCPAGWKPGKPTMVDDVVKSLDYFTKVN